ncbi:tetratricopeptide TPR_2 repeat protein [Oleiphilus messinensis]|uniref:Tetratricopeptide TPR_2 repeat protein n=1 Tax=Oleiphilus messinensis TaxID=141451 RepID=A0A1Y0IE98_9GAMM|nr:glycosyltransferase family 9 protein [Oleiphilus messinensis]ARU57713.1 tetratricopeptide TPR_2 repeat protein [Oleiphilus messinensis]
MKVDEEQNRVAHFLYYGAPLQAPEQQITKLTLQSDMSPDNIIIRNQLAYWQMLSGNHRLAAHLLQETLTLFKHETLQHYPDNQETLLLIAINLMQYRSTFLPMARAILEHLVCQNEDHSAAQFWLGNLCLLQGFPKLALEHFDTALMGRPESAEVVAKKASVLLEGGAYATAARLSEQAWELDPSNHQALLTKGKLAYYSKDFESAQQWYGLAHRLRPWQWDAAHSYGMFLLAHGHFQTGWKCYNLHQHLAPSIRGRQLFEKNNLWQGEPLANERIVIIADQGFGDAIQFSRYLPELAQRAQHITLICSPALHDLFRFSFGPLCQIEIKEDSAEHAIDDFVTESVTHRVDRWLTLSGLTEMFAMESFLKEVEDCPEGNGFRPYLHVAQEKVIFQINQLSGLIKPDGLKVGVFWHGNDVAGIYPRHIDLTALKPIFDLDGVQFISLAVNEHKQDLVKYPFCSGIVDASPYISSFYDTAAIIKGVDLVISIDSAVAHLAGALGKPVYLLLPYVNCWRWGLTETLTPWYPKTKLFRQIQSGTWETPVTQIVKQLKLLSNYK